MTAELEFTRGNLLEANVEALVNPVNTVGVMGKGLALQFKQAYPDVYTVYRQACDAGELEPGRVHVVPVDRADGPRLIIHFPTKRHWRSKSKLREIEAGLDDLARVLQEQRIASVAVPPLGCGYGGLDWVEVRPRIESALGELAGIRVLVFAPADA